MPNAGPVKDRDGRDGKNTTRITFLVKHCSTATKLKHEHCSGYFLIKCREINNATGYTELISIHNMTHVTYKWWPTGNVFYWTHK